MLKEMLEKLMSLQEQEQLSQNLAISNLLISSQPPTDAFQTAMSLDSSQPPVSGTEPEITAPPQGKFSLFLS